MSASGPLPRFTEVHEYRALELIGKYGSLGRKQLADELGVGEGSARTILKRLKERELITSTPRGHILTRRGREELEAEERKIVRINAGPLTVGKVDVATIVKNASGKVRFGVEQRDEAIKAGAKGATVLIFEDSKLQLPDRSRKIDEGIDRAIKEFLKPERGDVIVIGSGSDEKEAERGAFAAAMSLTGQAKTKV